MRSAASFLWDVSGGGVAEIEAAGVVVATGAGAELAPHPQEAHAEMTRTGTD